MALVFEIRKIVDTTGAKCGTGQPQVEPDKSPFRGKHVIVVGGSPTMTSGTESAYHRNVRIDSYRLPVRA